MASLNPCFNGRYSQSPKAYKAKKSGFVLILVLMEDTLRGHILGKLMPKLNMS